MRLTRVFIVACFGVVSAQQPQQPQAPLRPMFRSGVFVVGLDDMWAVRSAKEIAKKVVSQLSANDLVAVVFTYGSSHAQDFTTDRTKLFTAIDSLQPGPASHLLGWETTAPLNTQRGAAMVPMTDGDIGLRLGSMRTLRDVADTLIAAPQRRKALIFVSPGITVDFASDVPVPAGKDDVGRATREAITNW